MRCRKVGNLRAAHRRRAAAPAQQAQHARHRQVVGLVRDDIAQVLQACGKVPLKVILENCLLTDAEKVKACEICRELKVAFVKTSTGFSRSGATVEDVALMRRTVGPDIGVKASGGVRDYPTALAMIEAGATRLGTSSGIAIIGGALAAGEGY